MLLQKPWAQAVLEGIKLKVRGEIHALQISDHEIESELNCEVAPRRDAPRVTLMFTPTALAASRRSDRHHVSINRRYVAHIAPESGTSM